jgi:homoserine O-acetyltransferase
VGRQAIYADPLWKDGDYYDSDRPEAGLAVARMVGHITYMSDASMRAKFGRRLQNGPARGFGFDTEFAVESYLRYRGATFPQRFDANSYLYISKALDHFDLTDQKRSLAEALEAATAKFLVLSFTSDWLYPSYQSREIVRALLETGTDVTYIDVESQFGHDAFLVEIEALTKVIAEFLARVARIEARRSSKC